MVNEFKVGDHVVHEEYGNGRVRNFTERSRVVVKWDSGYFTEFDEEAAFHELRPRNFLSKIAEEQEKDLSPVLDALSYQFARIEESLDMREQQMKPKTFDQQFNEVFKPERFQRNAYGQLVDTVTGLEADSDGLVQIFSIRGSVRSIS